MLSFPLSVCVSPQAARGSRRADNSIQASSLGSSPRRVGQEAVLREDMLVQVVHLLAVQMDERPAFHTFQVEMGVAIRRAAADILIAGRRAVVHILLHKTLLRQLVKLPVDGGGADVLREVLRDLLHGDMAGTDGL